MTTVAEPPAAEPARPAAPRRGGRWRSPRTAAALGLVTIFAAACLVYGFQAWHHRVPWLFEDEILYASQAREYAATGHLTVRGEPTDANRLTAIVTSIAWHFDDPETSYLVAKLLNVVLMAAACFPAYGLARLVVGRRWALFAAAATVAIPAFVYTSMILSEPFAYLLATTAFWLVTRALAYGRFGVRPVAWWLAAIGVAYAASEARAQLRLLVPLFLFMTGVRLLLSDPVRRRRSLAAAGWISFGVLVIYAYRSLEAKEQLVGAAFDEWNVLGKMIAWSFGAFAIGLGVIPVVLGLGALWPDRERRRLPAHRSFAIVASVGIAGMIFYTGVKATYIYFTFAYRVSERNLMYAAPLVFVALAILLERRSRLNPFAVAAALAVVAWAVYTVPYQLSFRLYSDAPGLAILSTANRHLQWTDGSVRKFLAVVLALAFVAALCVHAFQRRRRALAVGAAVLGIFTVAFAFTGEVAADRSSRGTSTLFYENLPKPLDWIDESTGGARTVLVGTAIADPNGIWLTQFFNPNVWYLASMDGSAPPPGPNDTIDIVASNGRFAQQYPDAPFAVADNKVHLAGKVVRRTKYLTLYKIDRPLRLVDASYGVSGDGWMLGVNEQRAAAKYFQFDAARRGPGVIRVIVSRAAWGGPDVPGRVKIAVSRVRWRGPHDAQEGKLVEEKPFAVERMKIHTRQIVEYRIPVPGPPFVVNVTVAPTFSPAEFGLGDTRQLGLQPGFRYVPGARLDKTVRRELSPPDPSVPQG